jgi:hypothetical protein
MELRDLRVGMRVALHPATDLWMRGVRYADVVRVGWKTVTIEEGGRCFPVSPKNLEPVEDAR